MFSKSNLLATIAATVVMFLLGYGLWGVALSDFFESHSITDISKDPMDFPLIVVSNLIGAFILSSIYSKWARGHHSIGQGFEFGAAIGAFTGISMGLMWYATSNLTDFTGYIVEAIVEIIYYGIVGIVIALVYKNTTSTKA
ncbi:MAG: hypothetical protein ABJN84_12470 [Flavobacteriaceae bacterium]